MTDHRSSTVPAHVRQKNSSLRITLADTAKPQQVSYLAIDLTSCWSATFNAWGKRSEVPIVDLGGRKFKIVLEEIL